MEILYSRTGLLYLTEEGRETLNISEAFGVIPSEIQIKPNRGEFHLSGDTGLLSEEDLMVHPCLWVYETNSPLRLFFRALLETESFLKNFVVKFFFKKGWKLFLCRKKDVRCSLRHPFIPLIFSVSTNEEFVFFQPCLAAFSWRKSDGQPSSVNFYLDTPSASFFMKTISGKGKVLLLHDPEHCEEPFIVEKGQPLIVPLSRVMAHRSQKGSAPVGNGQDMIFQPGSLVFLQKELSSTPEELFLF